MWENTSQTQQPQQAAPLLKKPVKEESDALLLVQSVLCLAAVLVCVALRTVLPGAWEQLRAEGSAILSTGLGFEADIEFSRFAEEAMRRIETGLDGLVGSAAQPDAIGGFTFEALQSREVPAGASLEPVELDGTFTLPVSGRVTSPFGFRVNPLTGGDEFHLGTDISAAAGTPVAAARAGQVTRTGYTAGRGNYVVVRHGNGVQTLYQHLTCGLVRAGEIVREGQIIALSGETGNVTGPHLHLELIVDGVCVDPACAFPQLAG